MNNEIKEAIMRARLKNKDSLYYRLMDMVEEENAKLPKKLRDDMYINPDKYAKKEDIK